MDLSPEIYSVDETLSLFYFVQSRFIFKLTNMDFSKIQ